MCKIHSPFLSHLLDTSTSPRHTPPILLHIPSSPYLITLTMWCYLHADFCRPHTRSSPPLPPTLSLVHSVPFSQFSDKQERQDQSNVIAQQPANAICLKDQVFAIHLPLNSCLHHFSCFYSCYSSLCFPPLFLRLLSSIPGVFIRLYYNQIWSEGGLSFFINYRPKIMRIYFESIFKIGRQYTLLFLSHLNVNIVQSPTN